MDRIRTRSICSLAFFLVCLCQAENRESSFDDTIYPSTSESYRNIAIATTMQPYRQSRMYERGYQGGQDDSKYQDDHQDVDDDDQNDMKAISQGKIDYWGGYYDFLINEGSYKFWAVFQLATAALLIYSGFAALYYAKFNPQSTDDEYDDIFRRKRRSSPIWTRDALFGGLDSATFQRIIDAIAREIH